MRIEIIMSKLFGFSTQTYFNWKKDIKNRQIIALLNKYFSKQDMEEYLNTGQIKKLELIKQIDYEELNKLIQNYQLVKDRKLKKEVDLLDELDNLDHEIDASHLNEYNIHNKEIMNTLSEIQKDIKELKK